LQRDSPVLRRWRQGCTANPWLRTSPVVTDWWATWKIGANGGKLGSNKFKWDVLLILVYWGLKQTGIMGPNQRRWGTGYHPGLGHGKWYRCRSFLKWEDRGQESGHNHYIYITIRNGDSTW
jgi:hypothetical protein